MDQALANYKEALILSNELGNERFSAHIITNLGRIFWEKGELNYALENFKKGLNLFLRLEAKFEIAVLYSNIGMVYHIKGELEKAKEFYEKSLSSHLSLGDKFHIADCYLNIGEVYYNVGEWDQAVSYFKESLTLYQETGNTHFISHSLFYLVLVTVDQGLIPQSKIYIDILEDISKKDTSPIISQRYRLSKAFILKESDRVINKAEAQILFQQVAEEEMVFFYNKVFAMLNLCDLLLLEFKTTGSEEVLFEVKILINQFSKLAKEQNSFLWLAQAYWLQSKLALIELDIEKAQSLLKRAENLALGKGLLKLANEISNEYSLLFVQINKWQKFSEKKPVMAEIIELTQIDNLVERMISKRLYRKEEDVLSYAEKARKIVKKFEKPEQLQ